MAENVGRGHKSLLVRGHNKAISLNVKDSLQTSKVANI